MATVPAHAPPHVTDEARQRYARVAVRLARLRVERAGDLGAALRVIAETAAEAADVERAAIWTFAPDRSRLRCVEQWERTPARHSGGMVLRAADYPAYFAAMLEERVVAASNAEADPRTAAFAEPYLRPLNIGAMLDAPVRARGDLVGIVCLEHVGGPREWSVEEQDFAASVADLVALAMEAEQVRGAMGALRQSEERFRRIAESVSEAFWLQEPDGRVVYMSPACLQVWGIPADAACGPVEALLGQVAEPDRESAAVMWRTAAAGTAAHGEFRVVGRAGGEECWVHVRLIPAGRLEAPGRVVGTATDITARRRAEERLVHDAFHDALTGLPNRALFMDRLHHTLERCQRASQAHFAVLLADLDHFKVINDSLGHLAGDAALMAVAHRLKECVRAGDTVARLGGDEFALLLEEVERPEDAVRVAHRVAAALTTPLCLEGIEVFTSASIGIALGPAEHLAPADLLRSADTALYQAKDRGRGGFALFDQEMHAASVQRLRMETELRRAVDGGEFGTLFQPIVDLASGAVTGFEALVRWDHPERGCLLPSEFLALADERGLMTRIGQRVLRDACAHVASCRREGMQPTVAVNLSARQVLQPDLLERVDELLAEFDLPGAALAVELTEEALAQGTEEVARVLAELRERGIRTYIDDFGTGYSSLASLHRLPIDALKIDRSFLAESGGSPEIVQAVVRLAHALGLCVVAEGVESAAQRDQLVALGCDAAQGFFFAPPLESEAAAAMLPPTP